MGRNSMTPGSPSERDRAEVERSAAKAAKVELAPVEVDRYLAPPADTPYGLEYAFYLLGDNRGSVLYIGCVTGENLIPLVKRGAQVVAMDISLELVELVRRRLASYQINGDAVTVQVGSAYDTGLPDETVDVVFSMAVLHHLDLPRARNEIIEFCDPEAVSSCASRFAFRAL